MAFSFFTKKEDHFDYELLRKCKVCEHEFKGRFCNVCGEKVIGPYERSLREFLDSLLNAFTFLDGKFWRSFKLLVLKPGQLSRNIADGKRAPYMKMISLFFVANFFYFLFPVFDSYNSSLYTQLNSLGTHSIQAKAIVKERVEKDKIEIRDFQRDYQNQSTNLSKLFIVALVVALTIFLTVINYSKQNYFFDHLLVALEFYSFQLIMNLVIIANLFLWIIKIGKGYDWDLGFLLTDKFFTILTSLTLIYFLFRQQITFYHQKWYWAIPRAVLLLFLIGQSVHHYRMMLFYVTMWTL
ncbi:MAG: DUF3667 domain-containing protein [Bacteroidetes bacterium]|nr:DUF3667 domain-containing protein [Bacteroidota bacterium]